MDKMQMAHDMALAMAADGNVPNENIVAIVWQYADAMQAEADKRNKVEAEQKRKKMREMLNAPNTFVERDGQHFDDLHECEVDWTQAPSNAEFYLMRSGEAVWSNGFSTICPAPSFGFTGTHIVERPE